MAVGFVLAFRRALAAAISLACGVSWAFTSRASWLGQDALSGSFTRVLEHFLGSSSASRIDGSRVYPAYRPNVTKRLVHFIHTHSFSSIGLGLHLLICEQLT